MDYRLTPANGRVAHVSLRGRVAAERFLDGEWARIAVPLVDLLVRPDGPRDRQLILGDRVLVLEWLDRHAFVQAEKDGFCGYVDRTAPGADFTPTHWVAAPATHLYATPTIKRHELASLTFGTRLRIMAEEGRFAQTAEGAFVPRVHLRPLAERFDDPAAVAEMFLGTPYLWGGNSRGGIDCSGLVQAALLACGRSCPGDSDLQWDMVGQVLGADDPVRRGDLYFWDGHVAMAVDASRLIHANAFRMAVTHEGIDDALARIRAQEGDVFLGRKRL
jgi:cell wall-associated NlpC family hydrolase